MKKRLLLIVVPALASVNFGLARPSQDPLPASQPRIANTNFENLDETDPILDDIYVKLYHARMMKVKAKIGSKKATLSMLESRVDRSRRLLPSGAVSAEEHELRVQDLEVTRYAIDQLESELKEAESMLNIAIDRISLGLSMPICPDIPST